jgi:CDP-diacylglycerol---glycerol-3-phosphate 3-phosphatidyltransferase
MLSHHKEVFHAFADPVARLLLRAHVRPNHLTVAGFAVSAVAAHALAAGRLRTGAALLFLAGLFDFFDGALARTARQVTPFGAFLDSVVDRYSDMVVLFGVLLLYHRLGDVTGLSLTMVALAGTVMVSYAKARAESVGVDCRIGLMERPERLIVLIGGAAFGLLTPAVALLAVLANLTALQRIWHTRRAISAPGAEARPEPAGPLDPVARPQPLRTRLLYRRR